MVSLEKIASLAKRRGFVFPGSEIYGGFAGTYDYGPLGVAMHRNVVDIWMGAMRQHDNIAFLDSSIFTAPRVWEASGHVSGFSDPLVVCNACHTKHRADQLLEAIGISADEKMSDSEINKLFDANRKRLVCHVCGKKDFGQCAAKSLLATSTLGAFEQEDQLVYLLGETAQGIFINYQNVLEAASYSLPF